MDLDDIGFALVVFGAGAFICSDDVRQWWPYCLGAVAVGVVLMMIDRVLP